MISRIKKIEKSDVVFFVLSIVLAAGSALAIGNLDSDIGLYGLVGLVGIAVALTMFVMPSFGANLLIIAVFSNVSDELSNNGYPGIIKPLVVVVAATIAARFIYFEKPPAARSTTTKIEVFLFLYFLIYAFSFMVAADKTRASSVIFDVAKDIVVIYCLMYTLRSPEALKRAVWVVITVTFMLCMLGVYQSVTGNYSNNFFGFAMVSLDDFSGSTAARLGGPINAPNMWGQTVVSVIALVVFRIIHEKRLTTRLFSVAALGVFLFEVLNTYSRGDYLALAVVIVLILFVFEDKFSPMIAFAGVGIIILAIPFIPSSYTDRFASLSILTSGDQGDIYQEDSFRGRSSELLTGLSMFKSSPFLGVGAGNYKYNYQKYSQLIGIEQRAEARDPHSLYVQLLAENGILGFLAFVAVSVSVFSGLNKVKRSIDYLPALRESWVPWISSLQTSMIGYLIAATFLHGAYIRYFWILVGLSLTAIRLTDEMVEEANQAALSKTTA